MNHYDQLLSNFTSSYYYLTYTACSGSGLSNDQVAIPTKGETHFSGREPLMYLQWLAIIFLTVIASQSDNLDMYSYTPNTTFFTNAKRLIIHSYIPISRFQNTHYSDVLMGTMASQITSLTIIYSTVYSGADQRIH